MFLQRSASLPQAIGRCVWHTLLALCLLAPLGQPAPANASPQIANAAEFSEWKAIMAENSFRNEKSDENKFKLIHAYETVINKLCMPRLLYRLQYTGLPTNKKCLEYIEKALELFPESAAALCARDGIDAVTCRDAYARQIISEEYLYLKIDDKIQAIRPLERKVAKLEVEYRKESDPELMSAINDHYRKILNVYCQETELSIKTREEVFGLVEEDSKNGKAGATPAPQKRSGSSLLPDAPEKQQTITPYSRHSLLTGSGSNQVQKSPMEKLMDQLESRKGQKKLKEERRIPAGGMVRVRKMTRQCENAINKLMKVDPLSSIGRCYRDGMYSTYCVDALRQKKSKRKELDTDFSSPARHGGGMVSF